MNIHLDGDPFIMEMDSINYSKNDIIIITPSTIEDISRKKHTEKYCKVNKR